MTKNSKLMIKSKSLQPLTLNEAFDSTPNNKKYIFSGVFTACSVPGHVVINRNNRSYPEKEVLRHLGYLREMIKQSGSILGELDHPEGRFDIQLKEASHKITDLWYDQENHNVMGKLEILDTPNGKIAQELVEAGYPLFVSSRAAGDVDEKTHEVEIAQIFTYDIVCTPGFAEARLDRINESLGAQTMSYLNESVSAQKSQKETTNKKYKVLMEGVTVNELEQEAPINEKCMEMKNKPINLKDLSKPLLEEDEEEFKLPEADVTPDGADNSSSDSDNKDDKSDDNKDNDSKSNDNKSEPTDEEKQKKRALIIDITSEDANGETSDEDSDDKDEKRADIIDIEGQSDEDKADDGDADKSDDSEDVSDTDTANDDADDAVPADEDSKTSTEKAERIAAETEKDMEEFQDLLDNLEKKESIKEQIVSRYPFSISLSPENFAKFAALKPTQKKKCMKYVVEHNIYKIEDINNQWNVPLIAEKRVLKNWLRLADPKDIELYTKASLQEQDAIENMARYWVLENKQDVDEFWEKTGLRTREAQRVMNEEFVRRYKVAQKPIMKPVQESEHPLGYHMDYAKILEQTYNNI